MSIEVMPSNRRQGMSSGSAAAGLKKGLTEQTMWGSPVDQKAQRLHEVHFLMPSRSPSLDFFTMEGSAMWARAMATKSASFPATMASAFSRVRIEPTAQTGLLE